MSDQYIFFYGTLMSSEVYKTVTEKPLEVDYAMLNHFKIYSLQNRVYPGIIPSKYSKVKGLVTKVDQETLDRLDYFEGEEYDRTLVEVTDSKRHLLKAWTYVLKENYYSLIEAEGWDYENFLNVHLRHYLS